MVQEDKKLFIKIKQVEEAIRAFIAVQKNNSLKNLHFYKGHGRTKRQYMGSYSKDELNGNHKLMENKLKEFGAEYTSIHNPIMWRVKELFGFYLANSAYFVPKMMKIQKCIETKDTYVTESICQMCSGNNYKFLSVTNQFKVSKSTCRAVVGDCSSYWYGIFRNSIAQEKLKHNFKLGWEKNSMLQTVNDGEALFKSLEEIKQKGIDNIEAYKVDTLCQRFFNALNVAPINYRVNSNQFLDKFVNSKSNLIPKNIKVQASKNLKEIKKEENNIQLVSPEGVVSLANSNASQTQSISNMSKIRVEYFRIGQSVPFRSEIIDNMSLANGRSLVDMDSSQVTPINNSPPANKLGTLISGQIQGDVETIDTEDNTTEAKMDIIFIKDLAEFEVSNGEDDHFELVNRYKFPVENDMSSLIGFVAPLSDTSEVQNMGMLNNMNMV